MNQVEWNTLRPGDVIGSIVNGRQLLPVRLAVKDHNRQWIVYRLNNQRQPVEALTLSSINPEAWKKM